MRGGGAARSAVSLVGRIGNDVASFIVFTILDLLDVMLCLVYKLVDYAMESEWKPCYCSPSPKDMVTSSSKILVSENGGSKVVRLSSTKLQLEDISDTLYSRPSLLSEVSQTTVRELRRIKMELHGSRSPAAAARSAGGVRSASPNTTTFTINSTIIQMLQGKIGGVNSCPVPRWSDCDCPTCTSRSSDDSLLFVHAEVPKGNYYQSILHQNYGLET